MHPLSKARAIAEEIIDTLQPHCTRIHIAGSIRRQVSWVKDIEIVCTPKKIDVRTDLFGTTRQEVSIEFHEAIISLEAHRIKGHHDGRYLQSYLKAGITLDLFMPAAYDYYRQLVIRTSSREYSEKVIAAAWKRLGWVGAGEHGLRRQSDCEPVASAGKVKWKLVNKDGEKPPAWESEEAFYQWLGITCMPPVLREWRSSLNPAL